MKQTETETTRVKVDYAHLAELKRMECVEVISSQPRILRHVRSELTPEFPAIARFGEVIVQQRYRECPWVWPLAEAGSFAKVFNETDRREGGSDD